MEFTIEEAQCSFRKKRGTQNLIFAIRQIGEWIIKNNGGAHICFIDLGKAFDKVKRGKIRQSLEDRKVHRKLIEVKSLHEMSNCMVRVRHEVSDKLRTLGVQQGCNLSPLLFTPNHGWCNEETQRD